jgi:5'-3' exonuclease
MKRLKLKKIPKRIKPETTLLVDLKYLAYRSRYTQGAQLTYEDVKTTVPYYVLNTIFSVAKKFEITKCVICADVGKDSLRKKEYDGYKEKKNKITSEYDLKLNTVFHDEYEALIENLNKINMPVNHLSNYEADDLIAMYCKQYKNENIFIITRDEDMYQCLTDNITIYSPDDKVKKTYNWFKKEYGIDPSDWKMVKAIGGCNSDCVKGIKGVGEETALKFVRGDANPNQIKRIEENWHDVEECLQVVALPHPSLNECIYHFEKTNLETEGFIKFCQRLGFRQFLDNLHDFERYFQ